MDLSLLDEQILEMENSFLVSKPEIMDDEVTEILKKWNLNNPAPVKGIVSNGSANHHESFDTRTFTRPKRRLISLSDPRRSISNTETESETQSVESGISSINMQVGGPMSSLTPSMMQRSWLNDVSPPNSICTSMDFQTTDNMLNSLITSSDFSNVSFLLNGNEAKDKLSQASDDLIANVTPTTSLTRNLMDFTFNVKRDSQHIQNATFTADAEPMKEFGIENIDCPINDMTMNFGKNLTFDARADGANLTWENIQDHQNQLNMTIVQSTPVHKFDDNEVLRKKFDENMSPISSHRNVNGKNNSQEEEEVIIRNIKARTLLGNVTFDDYRNSMEDQCEFLLNEETIKLSSRVCGDTFECLDLKTALIQSASNNERDFDKMLDSFDVKKSAESDKILQSVDSIKLRHSLINFEKQREEKHKKTEDSDNKSQYGGMNQSTERLLRRSRLYDDVNLQVQKQQNETITYKTSENIENEINGQSQEVGEEIDKNNRDRFKTYRSPKKLQSGMVVVNDNGTPNAQDHDESSSSPGANKERQNQLNQMKQGDEEEVIRKPEPAPSRLGKFGFSRPAYTSRHDLNLPLKASSTDSLDNEDPRGKGSSYNQKSPMGVKSKSIHNLMFNGGLSAQPGNRMGSYGNLKLIPGGARSQSSLKAPRASSLVRPSYEQESNGPSSMRMNSQATQLRAPANQKRGLVRPSSGYYGNTMKRMDSDTESGCSLSSSSAGSRNNINSAIDHHQMYPKSIKNIEDTYQPQKKVAPTGAIPKPSGLRPPSNLRAPQARSGLPRPSSIVRR